MVSEKRPQLGGFGSRPGLNHHPSAFSLIAVSFGDMLPLWVTAHVGVHGTCVTKTRSTWISGPKPAEDVQLFAQHQGRWVLGEKKDASKKGFKASLMSDLGTINSC